MIGDHFHKLAKANETGRKVVYTFVPGNLTELMHTFDVLPVYPGDQRAAVRHAQEVG